jgi:AraC family transcriptional regulator
MTIGEGYSDVYDRRTAPSAIQLVGLGNTKIFPSAPAGSVLFSSAPLRWHGIIFERQRLEPQDLPEHYVVGHGLTVHMGKQPIPFHWKNGRRREGVMNPGEFHLLTDGDLNAPGWSQTLDEVSLVLDPRYVADVVGDGSVASDVGFASQRSTPDPVVGRYVEALCSELTTDSPNGLLYVDTLTIGLVLHLLTNYALAQSRVPLPRGKLSRYQLQTVVDFILSHLDHDVPLTTVAEQAHVSAFHFARQFRETVGLTPHQFVLRQRIQKSINLMRAGRLPLAQIAIECGFYDQAHFTRTFQKVTGTTPALYCPDHD